MLNLPDGRQACFSTPS